MQGRISLRNVNMPSRVSSRRPLTAVWQGAGLHESTVVQSGASKVSAVSLRLKTLLFAMIVYAC